MSSSLKRVVALALTIGALAGCSSERGSLPSPSVAPTAAASGDLIGSLAATLTAVTSVQRTVPLAQPITVSQVIDASGGVLSIPEAGVVVTVPKGALVGPTSISMTARAGSSIAYDFAPHGITFAKPLTFAQSLTGTDANPLNGLSLQLGYYADPSALTATGALVSELIDGKVDLTSWSFSAKISHFSGYTVACRQ